MVTGIETAGLVLATFPLIVKGLSSFVEGVDTFKIWRRYKWQLEEYAIQLEGHMVFYLDTLEELLLGIVDSDDTLAEMIRHPGEGPWRQPEYENKLKLRLGRSYDTYVATMGMLLRNLDELKTRLDLGKINEVSWERDSAVRREIKRLKLVLSRSIYNELISKIERANKSLRESTQQSKLLESSRNSQYSPPPHKVSDFHTTRTWTRSLYGILIGDKSWKCKCQKNHVVNLGLCCRSVAGINIIIHPNGGIATGVADKQKDSWESQAFVVKSQSSASPYGAGKVTPATTFNWAGAAAEAKNVPHSLPELVRMSLDAHPEGSLCLCDTIYKLQAMKDSVLGGCIGSLLDATGQNEYGFFTLCTPQNTESRSLESLLCTNSRPKIGGVMSRGDRLHIAMILAASILQVDDLWFENNFRSGNILIPQHTGTRENLGQAPCLPYLSHRVVPAKSKAPSLNALEERLIRNEALLGLCLTLVELAFGQTMLNLHTPGDIIPGHTLLTDFNTVVRLLPDIFEECGDNYGRVVGWCVDTLFNAHNCSFENDMFIKSVLSHVVTPLESDWKFFSGQPTYRPF